MSLLLLNSPCLGHTAAPTNLWLSARGGWRRYAEWGKEGGGTPDASIRTAAFDDSVVGVIFGVPGGVRGGLGRGPKFMRFDSHGGFKGKSESCVFHDF